MPIPDLASFIFDNNHGARFYFYYLIFYLKLILTEYYSKGLGARKFRPALRGFFRGGWRNNDYFKLMTHVYKLRGTYLPSRYSFLKDYDTIIRMKGHGSSYDFDAYDEDEILPEEADRVQKIRNEAYEDIFAYKEFRYYETHIREETECENLYYSYVVPKMYESYTWTRDKLMLLTEDLLELFNNPPDGALGTLANDHSFYALIASLVKTYSGLVDTFKQQIPLMETTPNFYSKEELENLRTIAKTLSFYFSEENQQKWEQLGFFSLHSGERWGESDVNPYNPHNSPTNHYKDLEILSW